MDDEVRSRQKLTSENRQLQVSCSSHSSVLLLPAIMRSIAMSMFVCLSVCLSARISQKPHVQISQNFWARSSSVGSAICYVLPVLWMTSCFHIMERMGQNPRRHDAYVSSSSPGGGIGSEVCHGVTGSEVCNVTMIRIISGRRCLRSARTSRLQVPSVSLSIPSVAGPSQSLDQPFGIIFQTT